MPTALEEKLASSCSQITTTFLCTWARRSSSLTRTPWERITHANVTRNIRCTSELRPDGGEWRNPLKHPQNNASRAEMGLFHTESRCRPSNIVAGCNCGV